MENKYYTPEIEEFHVGFEYEVNEATRVDEEQWMKDIFDLEYFIMCDYDLIPESTLQAKIGNKLIRVKYLDEADFISLGFAPAPRGHRYDRKDLQIYHTDTDPTYVEIYSNHGADFNGDVKNKSELRRLLKQLGYEVTNDRGSS